MTNKYYLPMYSRLEPCQAWRGGRITHTDLLTLEEAAREACSHSGGKVGVADFLRAAARGEITLRAIVHATAKVVGFDGGIFCNKGEATENTVPKGAIPTLPLVACQQLANAGRASWRTFDGFENVDGEMCRFVAAMLSDDEPDFETVANDCRVIGRDVHALADAFIDTAVNAEANALERQEKRLADRNADARHADSDSDSSAVLAALFDPVKPPQLEKMFPDSGDWSDYAERASRNGLMAAKVGRGVFNPFLAAKWWLHEQAPVGWDWARCLRVLANNIPPRSVDSKYLLTGDFE